MTAIAMPAVARPNGYSLFAKHALVTGLSAIPAIAITAAALGKEVVGGAALLVLARNIVRDPRTLAVEILEVEALGTAIALLTGSLPLLSWEVLKVGVAVRAILLEARGMGKLARKYCGPESVNQGIRWGFYAAAWMTTSKIVPALSTLSLVGGAVAGAAAGLFSFREFRVFS